MRNRFSLLFSMKCMAMPALLLGIASAVGAQQGTAPPSLLTGSKGRVLGLAFVGRMVGDLDKSVAFYKAIGFAPVEGVNSSWRKDEVMNRIHGARGVESRMAKFTLNSSSSGKQFTLYLREFRGIQRRNVMGGKTAWEPGATHIGLTVPDAGMLWSQLRAAGMLWSRTWDGKLVAFPGQTKGTIAYITDPDGMDVEIIEQTPATPATATQPARPADPPGFNHVGMVMLDIEQAKGFYGALLGVEFPATTMAWASGDFLDSATGGHGNILRLFNGAIADAADPAARMRFELVEYLNRKKPIEPFSITDIGVSYFGFEVSDIDALVARLRGAGIAVMSDGIVTMTGNYRVVLVRDPDVGGFVEFFERPKT